jgi:hypothetical protein
MHRAGSRELCIEQTLASVADNKGLTGRATQAAQSRDPVSHLPRLAPFRGRYHIELEPGYERQHTDKSNAWAPALQ